MHSHDTMCEWWGGRLSFVWPWRIESSREERELTGRANVLLERARESERQQWHSSDYLQAQSHKRPAESILQHAVWWVSVFVCFLRLSNLDTPICKYQHNLHYLFEIYKWCTKDTVVMLWIGLLHFIGLNWDSLSMWYIMIICTF